MQSSWIAKAVLQPLVRFMQGNSALALQVAQMFVQQATMGSTMGATEVDLVGGDKWHVLVGRIITAAVAMLGAYDPEALLKLVVALVEFHTAGQQCNLGLRNPFSSECTLYGALHGS